MRAGLCARTGAGRRRQRGLASVEFALCIGVILSLLPAALLFGRTFLYYNVLLNASRGAAHYMAAVPLTEMSNLDNRLLAMANARQIVLDAATDARLEPPRPTTIKITCNGEPCDGGTGAPGDIRIWFEVALPNDLLADALWDFRNGEGFTIKLDVTVPYAN